MLWVLDNLLLDHVGLPQVVIVAVHLAVTAVQVLSADIVPPARACTAFECTDFFIPTYRTILCSVSLILGLV